ncbi:membrane bound O-acyl transferase family-domain-containing protein [Crucibulum laeve]|uniref:Membrane bound O-acyl transferase family-domain-containing protein n=1 Tax=Crucibulum laeve TaxID=68775 RepID=A0A5C3LPQ4_9AGAR|nr:membrane bound O-acyl transferase family-domain-containing protein [Crucibulum laeve]
MESSLSPTSHRAPYSPALHGVTQVLLLLALVLRPSGWRWLFFPPILAIILYLVSRCTTGDLITDVGVGSALFTQLVTALDYILLTDVQTELRRVDQPKDQVISGEPLRTRFKWALSLFLSPRGIGWAHAPSHLPPAPTKLSRSSFVVLKLRQCFVCILLEVFAYIQNASNPAFTSGRPLEEFSYFWRNMGLLGFGAAAYARINFLYCVFAALAVGVGVSEPREWPELFGGLLEAWSVSRFWRRTWHQLLRRPLCITATSITRLLRLPRRSMVSSLVYLFSLFFVSGVVHGGGEYMMAEHGGLGAFKFFLLQAVAVAFEKLMVAFFGDLLSGTSTQDVTEHHKHAQPSRIILKLLGYIWTWSWFVWSIPYMLNPMITAGMFVNKNGKNLGRLFELWGQIA